MIVLYFVVDDVQVTNQADINRKELTLELSIFCFQWVVSFWTFVLILAVISIIGRTSNRIMFNLVLSLLSISLIALVVYLYYSNLILMTKIRDLNMDLTQEEQKIPT